MRLKAVAALALLLGAACDGAGLGSVQGNGAASGGTRASPDGASPGGASPSGGESTGMAAGGAEPGGGPSEADSGTASGTDGGETMAPGTPPAAWELPPPESSLRLPKPAATNDPRPGLYYPDLPGSFPDVDFDTLDRLYLPAGDYSTVLLGGLPERAAGDPLVITNQGGQVKVGGDAANYVFVIRGGTNWILTGRYDAQAQIGDPAFRGHGAGAYAHSQGTYGILIDDGFSKEGLSGLAIGSGATDFEIDMLEITRAEFAGITAKTDDDGSATMRNVKVHDLYIHDVGSEGIYFGSTQAQPQHSFEGLQIYDNRFLRTGTEALQVGQLGGDCDIHHNVLGPAALRWRSAFQRYQDGNVQYGQRYGSSRFHHNVVIGTGDLFVEFFPTPVDGDPRSGADEVAFVDNYFSDTSASGVYTHAEETGVTVRFERNVFRGFLFDYASVYPDAEEPVQVFGVGSNTLNPHVLLDNTVDGPYPFIRWTFDSVTERGNTAAPVEPVKFRDFMGADLDENYRQLEWWTDIATLSPDQRAVVYPEAAFVMHRGVLYQALSENQAMPPDESPAVWQALPAPADDVRLTEDSPHAGVGLR